MTSKRVVKCLDFFCGAGGLTRGLLDASIHVVCGVDHDERFRETYERNNPPSRFECADIADIDIKALRCKYGVDDDDLTLYAACTPCQPFSTLNQRRGADDRKELLLSFAELVRKHPPDFLVVENVPGLGNAYGQEVYRRFLEVLDQSGLIHRDADKLDAKDFAVPQIRKRFILLASRHGDIRLPSPAEQAPGTVRSAIEHLPRPGADSAPPNHNHRPVPDHHRAILAEVPQDGGSRSDVADKSVLLECHRRNPGVHKDVFGRMQWDEPAPTLTCRCTDVYCGRFAHPVENRGLTIREAAALQTFSDDYEFVADSIYFAARQVGNAVPVTLASRLGQVVTGAAALVEQS